MIANIISRYSFILTDTLNTSGHTFKFDSDYDGKSQITFYRKPKAEEDDFILIMDGKDIAFQGIISKIENESNSDAYKVTAVEMQTLFNQKVILSDESIKTETGIEDFIADQITKNFISSDDALVNIDYLTVTANTHTPIATAVSADDGIYNLKSYIANAMTMYGVFVEFEFTSEALNVVIEKKAQSEFKIDATLPEVQNLTEVIDYQPMTKLTVIWKPTDGTESTHQFFLRTDRTITTDMEDEDRAKGSSDIIVSTAETEAAMIQEAHDAFTSNSYNHKITFDVSPDSKMIPSKQVIEAEEEGGSKLPDGYRQLTYIESTGTQYVDTEFKVNQNSRVVMAVSGWELTETATSVWGARSGSADRFDMFVTTDGAFRSYYGSSYVTFDTSLSLGSVLHIDRNKADISINGNTLSNSANDFAGTQNLYILGYNASGTLDYEASAKLYSCQIYDNDVLVRNFIPCRNPSGDVGLYDLVAQQFFGNAGTGVFKQGEAVVGLPEGYEHASYIESTGTQYIDTGFVPNQDTGIELDVQVSGVGGKNIFIAGQRATTTSQNLTVLINTSDAFRFGYNTSTTSAGNADTERHILKTDKNVFYLDGSVTRTATYANFEGVGNIYLFAINQDNSVYGQSSLKLYSCQIYDNGIMVRDYIPCKNYTGEFGLYDLVEGKFYGNVGTGAFTGEIVVIEGVEDKNVAEVTRVVNTLYVGRFCTIKTKNGIRTSIITAMELNSESSMIGLIFGKLKVTLIEKLKGVEARK